MELYDFLRRVRLNNNREWLAANRDEYDYLRRRWLGQVDTLIEYVSGVIVI